MHLTNTPSQNIFFSILLQQGLFKYKFINIANDKNYQKCWFSDLKEKEERKKWLSVRVKGNKNHQTNRHIHTLT